LWAAVSAYKSGATASASRADATMTSVRVTPERVPKRDISRLGAQ
jgi:hypothetical protein